MENLETSSHKVAEQMYKTAGEQAKPAAAPPPGETGGEEPKKDGDDDVIDAEFEVKE
jgi:hypothetical protein